MANTPLSPLDLVLSEDRSLGLPEFKFDKVERQETTSPVPQYDTRSGTTKSAGQVPGDLLPVFESAAQKYNVPVNVILGLAEQESRFNSKAVGQQTKWGTAKGIMQYLDSTAAGMGINPFDAPQSIDAAAKQIRQRLDKGYSMEDAVKEHFAGPDRRQWGPKTAQYGVDVMERAARFGGTYQPSGKSLTGDVQREPVELATVAPSPLTLENQDKYKQKLAEDMLAELNTSEPGRYSLATPEQIAAASKSNAMLPGADATEEGTDGFWSATGKALRNIPGNFQEAAGGLLRSMGEGVDDNTLYFNAQKAGILKKLMDDGVITMGPSKGGLIETQVPYLPDGKMADISNTARFLRENVKELFSEEQQAVMNGIKPNAVVRTGIDMAQDAKKDRAEINPDGPLAKYGSMIISSTAEMAPALIAGAVTRRPEVTLSMIGGQVYGQSYERGRTEGLNPDEAGTYAAAQAAAEAIPSILPVHAILAPGKQFFKGLFKAGLAESIQEGITGALQAGIDKGTIDPNMTWEQARQQIIDSAIVGFGAGTALRAGTIGARKAKDAMRSDSSRLGEEMDRAVDDAQFDTTPEQEAVAALDPNTQPVVQADPVPQPADPSGPLGRALNRAVIPDVVIDPAQAVDPVVAADPVQDVAPEVVPESVTEAAPVQDGDFFMGEPGAVINVAPPGVDPFKATIEGYADGEVLLRDQEGNRFQVSRDELQSAPDSSSDVDTGAKPEIDSQPAQDQEAAPAKAEQASVEQQRAEPKTYDQMDEAELRERLTYLGQQAKTTGWNKRLIQERRKVESAIEAKSAAPDVESQVEAAPTDQVPAEKPVKWFGSRAKAEGYLSGKELGESHEVVDAGRSRFEIRPKSTTEDSSVVPPTSAESAPVAEPPAKGGHVNRARKIIGGDVGDIITPSADVGYSKAGNSYRVTRIEKNGSVSVTNELNGSSTVWSRAELERSVRDGAKFERQAPNPVPASPKAGDTVTLGSGKAVVRVVDADASTVKVDVGGRTQSMTREQYDSRLADAQRVDETQTLPTEAQQSIVGSDIDGNWASFTPASGTLNIPRAEMPQIKAEHRGAMVNFLNARGIAHEEQTVPATSLKPTQAEFSREKVRQALGFEGGDRSILVSSDGHVLDGHHQWMAKREAGEPVRTIRLDAPIKQLLDSVREFPSATQSDGVADAAAKPAVSENKIFTEDAAEKARALLRSKLSQLNSGIDPEIMQAGITLAGYHIEKGARTFAAYAKAMTADMGDMVRPYLKSWYLGVRFDPRASSFDGMSGAAEVEAADIDATIGTRENTNEPSSLDQPGPRPLERASAGEVRGPESQEPTGERSEGGGRADARRDERAGSQRNDDPRGLGNDQGELSIPAARGERGRAAGNRKSVQRGDVDNAAGRRDGGPDGTDPGSVTPSNGVEASQRAGNYTITDADAIGSGGAKTKYKANVEAINTLKALEESGRQATREEQAILAKYVGWGGLPQAFERSDKSASKGWEREVAELRGLLSPEEYSAAASSAKNAHYTSQEIVDGMWQAMRRLGFDGGRLLEPSVGVGNFLGRMPHELRKASALNGVELDRLTSGIAAQLYPDAKIARMGFQDYVIPDGHFDAVIGNPPFGRESLYDGRRKDISGFSIHNYFFAKSLDGLRPGGVLAMVVTNRMLDVPGDKARQYMSERADLIGAIRLPNDAFMANAGTAVTTDIIFMRKRGPGELPSGENWTKVVDHVDRNGDTVPVNEYFANNPDNMLGDFGAFGSMYREGEPALIAREGQDTAGLMREAIARLPEGIMTPTATVQPETPATVRADHVRVGSMFLDGDTVKVRGNDALGENTASDVAFPSEKARDRVLGMIGIRDTLASLRGRQLDANATTKQIEASRKSLNTAYDAFVKDHGPINLDANKRLFRDDPSWPQLSALENNFEKGVSAAVAKNTGEQVSKPSAEKAAIFSKRTQSPYRPPESAASAKDSLVTALAETGRVDLPMMQRLYGKSSDAIIKELGDLVYQDPAKGYVTNDEYLSGNVKAKLAQAREAAQRDPAFARNVEALEAVQPADIEAVDINVKVGASWVPADVMGEFAQQIGGGQAKAVYNPATAKWSLVAFTTDRASDQRYGTSRMDVKSVVEAAANQKMVQVFDKHSDGSRTLNEAETQLANDKVALVKEEWGRWVWADDARRERLGRLYNDTFNTNVQRQFDGSHLTFPGKVGDDIIKLRPHQAHAVWRIVQSDTTLTDHVVGAGKTFTLVAAAMEMRRMGLARKPMFAVPNHLVGQWAADFVKLYPGANVLATTKADFEKNNRKRLFARIATGDWDAVIVAHSSFGKVEVEPREQAAFIEEQIADLDGSIELMRQIDGEKSRNIKDVQKRRDALREKLKKLIDSENKDDSLYWGELGVDALFLDEAHEFKNLAFSTSMSRVAGLGNQQGSQKAADMFLKSRQVLKATGGRNVTFATGTPISNTMAEMYTMQRYLDYGNLKGQGLSHFDAWARMFGEVVTDWELSPSGKYKLNSRFAKFVNMPELMQRYSHFADVINRDDINRMLAAQGKRLPVPKIKGGKPENVVVERSPDQARYIGEPVKDETGADTDQYPQGSLVYRAENMPKKAEKGADNMLKIMGDARKAALDMRLIDPSYPDFAGSKVNQSADRIRTRYLRWNEDRGTQLVFIDLSTPKNSKAAEAARLRDLVRRSEDGDEAAIAELDKVSADDLLALDSDFSVYDDLKQKLILRGIPEAEIAFIHDAKTEIQKEELYGKVRSGRIRVLLGSTAKMGAGMNVQDRLVALHHLDAPWRPSDLEQREGRIIRQGNRLYERDPDGFEIEIFRYATKQTLDSRMWQTIEGKANFIEQVRKGSTGTREIEDVGGEAANAAEMKAASSGNPMILEEMSLRQKIRRLENERQGHDREQYRLRDSISSARRRIASAERELTNLRADQAVKLPEQFEMTIDGQSFDKRKDAGEAILAQLAEMEANKAEDATLGKFGGFTVTAERIGAERYSVSLDGAGRYETKVEIGNDPVGAVMRITNTVKDLSGDIERAEYSRDRAAADIPKLEAQASEWSKSQDLSGAKSRHAEVLEELKPKKTVQTVPADQVKASIGDSAALDGALRSSDLGSVLGKLIDSKDVVLHDTAPDGIHPETQGWTDADGKIHLVADKLTADNASAVLLHEAFHSGGQSLVGTERWKNLLARLNGFYKAGEEGRLQGDWADAFRRVQNAQEAGDRMSRIRAIEELGAYAIENYERAPAGIKKWAESILGAVKEYAYRRFGIQLGKLDSAQLRAMAKAALRSGRTAPTGNSTVQNSIGGSLPTDQQVDGWFTRSLTDAMAGAKSKGQFSLLATAPMDRMIEELAGGNMHATHYLKLKRDMDAYRAKKHSQFDTIAQQWLKLNVTDRAGSQEMSRIMHDATIAQADPAEGFTSIMTPYDEKVMRDKPDSDEGKAAFEKKVRDDKRKTDHAALKRRFDALSPEMKDQYRKVRDTYKSMTEELDQIIMDNLAAAIDLHGRKAERVYESDLAEIRDDGLTGEEKSLAEANALQKYNTAMTKLRWNKKARLTMMRQQFEANRLEGPYFPLSRFGDLFVTVRDRDTGEVISFSRFENSKDQQRFAADARRLGNVQTGLLSSDAELRGAVDPRFVADVEDILGGASVPDAVKDQVWQRYLESMPDMSMRKAFIHRKNREGYTQDALRAFANRMFHGAHQLGRLKFGTQMQEAIEESKLVAKSSRTPERDTAVVNEINRRHDYVMNPKGLPWAQRLTSAAFIYHLSVSPAAALVNLSQTAIIGIPVIGAKFGTAKTAFELSRALKHFVTGKGRAERSSSLNEDERKAIRSAYDAGIIDSSQAHNLAGVGETGVEYSAVRNKVMGIIAWQFHQAERLNREVTFLAAYRLARKDGMTHDRAVEEGGRLTYKTHFDYANTNRPRVMHGDVAKVALVFRNYQVNMLWRLFRDTHQAIHGDPAARKEAIHQLAGITGMMGMSAGVKGVWLYGLAMALASMIFGDDAEDEFKKGTVDLLGPNAAGLLLNGIPGHATGTSLSGRIGMPDLWFRSPDRQLEGKDEFNYWQSQLLGALPGIAQNFFLGAQHVSDGKVYRGIETMAPKAIKDVMRASRFANEGATTMRGDPLVTEFKPSELAAQMIGFTPAVLAEQYERNSSLKNAEKRIMDKRRGLMDQYAAAYKLKDDDAKATAMEEIKAFNKEYKEVQITPQTIRQSLQSRRKYSERSDGGVTLNPKLDKKLREEVGGAIYR
ncbi:PLxRFG domain-containing protein [Agrobacterium tumefaciens]|uniref:PLxRFG domain-containing protein n=1 Tax=Agrobacterium tumefaciens TaxID=358 RepID=UPI001573E6C5|nr:PLxRFG domain-containing protein [Agrobacterium tumefaciens]